MPFSIRPPRRVPVDWPALDQHGSALQTPARLRPSRGIYIMDPPPFLMAVEVGTSISLLWSAIAVPNLTSSHRR
jgi:hypothetical protein